MNPSKIAVALAASLFLVTASAQDKGGPSDPQIAGIVVAADQIDIDAGKLAKSHTENTKNLKSLKGAAFDKVYVDHEVAYHQQVLDAIDKVLIPSAKNAELKNLIVKVRPAIAAHLDHAKMIQSDLAKK